MRSQETSQPAKYLLKTESLKVKAGIEGFPLMADIPQPKAADRVLAYITGFPSESVRVAFSN